MKGKTCQTCKHHKLKKFIVGGNNSRTVKSECALGVEVQHPDISVCDDWEEK